ncbi:MAG: U32 family peptidase, partial [Clostridiales bacterium]|nr:U32 family peptidase [Clostridiales bacterium]
YLCENSPIETEIFVHGALCVSFSGQCLMSSVIGGRSGNRGECAQPCGLPYKCKNCYPLSLKDSCLASHITDILPLGVASLKIEGRMKGADYVFGVTSIY